MCFLLCVDCLRLVMLVDTVLEETRGYKSIRFIIRICNKKFVAVLLFRDL